MFCLVMLFLFVFKNVISRHSRSFNGMLDEWENGNHFLILDMNRLLKTLYLVFFLHCETWSYFVVL